MNIESNINHLSLLMNNCLDIEVNSEDGVDYYFAYKSIDGFAIGYFYTKSEALLVNEYISSVEDCLVSFNLYDDNSGGFIAIERKNIKTNLIIPFYIKPDDKVIRYNQKTNL